MPFTGGAPQVVSDVFTLAANIGQELRDLAEEKLDAATLAVQDSLPPPTESQLLLPIDDANVPVKPSNLDQLSFGQVLLRNEALRDELEGAIEAKITTYFDTIFPIDNNLTAAQAWLERVLSGQGALDEVFEERIWERERNRAQRDATRLANEALTTWAARGYALPPGAAVGAVNAIRREELTAAAGASRDVAIKTYETEIALMQQAIDTTIRMRVEAIRNMAEYVKTATIEPLLINEVEQGTADIQGKLTASATEYFKLEGAYASYRYDKDKDFIQFARDWTKFTYDVGLAQLNRKVDLALEAAKMAATQAAAALNGLHGSASISGSDNTSTTIYA